MDAQARKYALAAQRTEITEYHIYKRLARKTRNAKNAEVLNRIAEQEKQHAAYWESKTGQQVKPDKWRLYRTLLLARFLGLSFALKLMEEKEGTGADNYVRQARYFPEAADFAREEGEHEKEILKMLEGGNLTFVGSVVLGLNDALVELTGALAGFTLALGETKIISIAGLVTGISAALSMAASEFLSTKAEGDPRAKEAALYTGISYLGTVILLILPFFLVDNKFVALGIVLVIALLIIWGFNYYVSVVRDLDFKKRFLEMAAISMGVAAFSFLVGFGLKALLGVDV
ncbi:VIT1/CCC1 transporter family protein [Anaerophaga thermohalophila]|uniref:VIT1/CCC1 transporter family protein n=1 Tax=Anaerophaga thermohalophila TaxID=177400 RepID=UPI0002D73BF5|nr:VIT1/CCC1 transporter family protein [Anaerophaga thermohalophila]